MERQFNFAAGPSAMPLPVLEQIRDEMLCYPGAGSSVLEMSHRSPAFQEIHTKAQESLRRLMRIPEDYAVLFLQGGASLQFSMIPMNLMERGGVADYVETGSFAKKAAVEAARWGTVHTIFSGKAENYSRIPKITEDMLSKDASYLHITGNNTIYGTTYHKWPKTGGMPLVADLSSCILGLDVEVTDFDLIYAGAQKNMAPAGLTVVIVKKSLLKDTPPEVPAMLSYKLAADNDSMYNTPNCFAIYAAGLVFKWLEGQGGVAAMEAVNRQKAVLLYDVIDASKLYKGCAEEGSRSITNVTFTLPTEEQTAEFIKLAKGKGIINIKGHRAAGGIRASIYNAMPVEGVRALADFMKEYETK
ncbi:MAG TPA: 3-phosphoserine/phosphohydroxythreonine transaminase [Candidatus Acidoferrum sp.]|nr:3-phosphoserine/phosphohydroxythreonine transaminase [Candidatus Acidoferrum sp.]